MLTGTIKNADGNPLQPKDINMVSVSRSESSQGPVLPDPNNTYDSTTGTYTFNNCLAGDSDTYRVHVSISDSSPYDDEGVTLITSITGGTTNTVNITVPYKSSSDSP